MRVLDEAEAAPFVTRHLGSQVIREFPVARNVNTSTLSYGARQNHIATTRHHFGGAAHFFPV